MPKVGKCGCNTRRAKLREARLEIVAELYKRGYTYAKIRTEVMARLGLPTYSKRTVMRDVYYLLDEWKAERVKDIDQLVSLELKRIDETIVELWGQGEASKREMTKKTQKQTGIPIGGMDTGEGGAVGGSISILKMESNKTSEERLGDPRYISEIRQQLMERRKLLGLYAPEKKDIQGSMSFSAFLMESGMIDEAEQEAGLKP